MASSDKKRFWTTLFEENRLASKLHDISTHEEGRHFSTSHFGDVLVKSHRASALGDNFMSDTFIIEAITSDGSIMRSFVKVLPSNAVMREAAYSTRVYHRELCMYLGYFDTLREIRSEAGATAQEIPLNVPETYYGHIEDIVKGGTDGSGTAVVIEELKSQGFVMIDKVAGADFEHANVALTSLAHYHALTIAFIRKHKNPDGVTVDYPEGSQDLAEKSFFEAAPSDMLSTWVKIYIDLMKLLERHDMVAWIESLLEQLDDLAKPLTIAELGPMACVLHGDFWNNNMLYKHDEEAKPIALRMVDFQLARVYHPVYDIQYYVYSSMSPENRQAHLHQLLHNYFTTVDTSLQKLNIHLEKEGYNFDSFFQDFKKFSKMSMLIASMVVPMILEKKVVGNLENLDKEMKSNSTEDFEEKEKGVTGMSLEMEEKMQSLISGEQISKNEVICHRVVSLFDEVKSINET